MNKQQIKEMLRTAAVESSDTLEKTYAKMAALPGSWALIITVAVVGAIIVVTFIVASWILS